MPHSPEKVRAFFAWSNDVLDYIVLRPLSHTDDECIARVTMQPEECFGLDADGNNRKDCVHNWTP